MKEHDDVNWSAVLCEHILEALHDLKSRNIAHAVATSERFSSAIDPHEVATENTAETIRKFRDTRYGKVDLDGGCRR